MVYLKRLIRSIFISLLACNLVGACNVVNAFPPIDDEKKMNECNRIEHYRLSKKLLIDGTDAILNSGYIQANKYLDDGISMLGDSYINAATIDDSGMKLTLANIEESNGYLQISANLKKGVLESRIHNYELKYKCKI